jgi:2-dehydro-3-deoxygalactonokinase
MVDGRIARFTTAMTGELFGLVRAHGILSAQLGADVTLGDAFLDGVREGQKRDLTASLFGIRAAKLLGLRDDADAASFASGLVIGADVASRAAANSFDTAYILADPALGALYAAAVKANGRDAVIIDSHAAFVAGITRIGAFLS